MWKSKSFEGGCEQIEARLEDAAELAVERGEGLALSADLAAHVSNCARCSEKLDAMALSRSLLRSGLEPAAQPGPYFIARVMAAIRAEEGRRSDESLVFWRPLEHLAARMAMAAAMVVMLLSFYAYAYVLPQSRVDEVSQNQPVELVPHQQADAQPQTKDEVLMSLVEGGNGR